MNDARRTDALAVASLALIVTIAFGDVLAGVDNFYMRDLTRYYYPTKQILREIVQGGEFPYWNRYFAGGQPIAANPEHEVFYPFTWLILLPSYDLGYRLLILMHLYVGILGMYALLRSMELRPFAAWFGAMAFGMGGMYLSEVNLLPILFCAAWLPLTCMFARRFLLRPSLRDFAAASLFLGLQFLVAEPTTVMQTGFLIGLYALYRGWYAAPRVLASVKAVGSIALIALTALAAGGAQILPAIDHVHDSARSRPFEFDLVSAWSMPWAKFAELIYPNILGHIAVNRVMWYWGGGLYPGMGSPFLFNIYVGLLTTALCVAAAFVRPRGGRLVLLICVVSAILALGGHTPILHLLYKAGIATSIRYPEKFAMMGIFAAIVFAAQMFDRLLAGDEVIREAATGFVIATTVVAAACAILGFTPIYARTFMHIWGMTRNAASLKMVTLSHHDWILAAIRGAAASAILITSRLRWQRAWMIVAGLLVAADLTHVGFELNPRMPRRFFEPPPVASTFPQNRADFRVFHEADWYSSEETARKFFSTGNAVYWIVRDGLFPMTPAGSKIRTVIERDYDKTALLPTIALNESVWDVKRSGRADWWEPFMAMSNAWYRGTYRDVEVERKRVKGDFKNAMPVQFIETTHWPRYYFADLLVTIHNRQDFVNVLSKQSVSPRVAFVKYPNFVPADGRIRGVRETANRATLDVESLGTGFLVMSVTPHKYWRITLDGRPVPAIVANIGYQGIVVPAGRHRVEMRYRNELVIIGLWISATTLSLLTGVLIFYRA
ncbi:MAG: YfhO family protein [Acidobacteriota bacterium]|nr:YfhO family protein [Acidobacteriota bacterium]